MVTFTIDKLENVQFLTNENQTQYFPLLTFPPGILFDFKHFRDKIYLKNRIRILQLFLPLASHTAGKLYALKQQTVKQKLDNLKENEKIAEASQSDLNIKNLIETFLCSSSKSMPSASNPAVLNENSTISSHFR